MENFIKLLSVLLSLKSCYLFPLRSVIQNAMIPPNLLQKLQPGPFANHSTFKKEKNCKITLQIHDMDRFCT